jgi:ribulose-phosphate 3-epimerase
MKIIAPSILSADFSNLEKAVRSVESVTNWLHLDVMDGHFVDNLTIGPPVVKSLRQKTQMFFDLHLMVQNPSKFIKPFKDAGGQLITVHVEAQDPMGALKQIKEVGLKAGVALSPESPADVINQYLALVDLVLVMSVNPGFGGQSFIMDSLEKIKEVRRILNETQKPILVEVDGGVNLKTAKLCSAAGADVFVAGSAVFSLKTTDTDKFVDPATAVAMLQGAVNGS